MGVYGAFLKNGFLTQMAHRGQYAMRMLAKIMGWSTGMIMVLILLERFGQIGGWNREEILMPLIFCPTRLQRPFLWDHLENCTG